MDSGVVARASRSLAAYGQGRGWPRWRATGVAKRREVATQPLSSRIGVGRTHWFASLPPPNRTGGSPASGSPVGGLTSKRIDGPKHGPLSSYTTPARERRRSANGSCPPHRD